MLPAGCRTCAPHDIMVGGVAVARPQAVRRSGQSSYSQFVRSVYSSQKLTDWTRLSTGLAEAVAMPAARVQSNRFVDDQT